MFLTDGHCSSIIIPREAGGYIVSNDNKLLHLDWSSGTTNELAVFDQETTHVLNDGKCDAKGRLWIGKYQVFTNHGTRAMYKLQSDDEPFNPLYINGFFFLV